MQTLDWSHGDQQQWQWHCHGMGWVPICDSNGNGNPFDCIAFCHCR